MIGAIIGDVVGSVYEFDNIKTKDFPLLTKRNFITDDTVMTLAVAQALMKSWDKGDCDLLSRNVVRYMQMFGREYPLAGYGGMFSKWLIEPNPKPYNSFGNGAAMRVSPCGFAASSIEEARLLSNAVTRVTHNHPEGLKGAEATAVCIFLARQGKSKEEIREYVEEHYYKLNFTLDGIRQTYQFNETCQDTVPQALECFFESESFEDSMRNAISIGGDSDTLAAIMGGISEAYYGVPEDLQNKVLTYLDDFLTAVLFEWEQFINKKGTPWLKSK